MTGAKSLYTNGRSELNADLSAVERYKAAEAKGRVLKAREANSYERLSREQIVGAKAVRVHGFGWRVVARVNARTVTVFEPLAWDGSARYRFDQIVEVKS